MKDFAPAFDFYPERWTHGTRPMNKVERCDYLDLLCHQWTDDGLPDDLDLLARMLGYKRASQIPAIVLAKFPVAEDGKRRNPRLEIERGRQKKNAERHRKGAQLTNAKRHAKRHAERTLSDPHSERRATETGDAERTLPLTSDLWPLSTNNNETHTPRARGSGYPDSEDQAKSMAVTAGVDPAYAATLWHEIEGRDGLDSMGNRVTNFASFAKGLSLIHI